MSATVTTRDSHIKEGFNDIDGNVYTTVTIGNQEWMVENLKTTKYADGTPIPNITVSGDWVIDVTGAYCWYNNDIANKTLYGALYNWYAVNNAHGLAPTGWRIPTETDWATLITEIGGAATGGRIKETGFTHWTSPNTGAENYLGMCALPAGFRHSTSGDFASVGTDENFWASTGYNSTQSYRTNVRYDSALFTNDYNGVKSYGFSVRCMRDVT